MLQQVIDHIQEPLSELCWAERLCGLSKIARKTVKGQGGKMITESYPISCKVDAGNCFKNGKYTALVPDDAATSLLYWQQAGNVLSGGSVTSRKMTEHSVALDLIVWLNLPKLGIDNCGQSEMIMNDLLRIFAQRRESNVHGVGNIEYRIAFKHSCDSVRRIFNAYAYGDIDKLFFYPYEALAFRVNVNWNSDPKCLPGFECDEPINCVIL